MAGQPYRSLCLVAISAAGSFEFEAAIIRDIHLLVRVIDQKQVRADAKAAEIGRSANLIEIGGSQPRLLGVLDNAARVDAVDASTVIYVRPSSRSLTGSRSGCLCLGLAVPTTTTVTLVTTSVSVDTSARSAPRAKS